MIIKTWYHNVNSNTILVGRYRALCGNVHIVLEPAWATEHAFRVRPLMKFSFGFVARFIEALELRHVAARSAQPGLNLRMVRENPIVLPPYDEQEAISAYLTLRRTKIAALCTPIKASVDRLHELRSALITAAVTGQIGVATWGKRGTTDRRLEGIESDMAAAAQPKLQQARA